MCYLLDNKALQIEDYALLRKGAMLSGEYTLVKKAETPGDKIVLISCYESLICMLCMSQTTDISNYIFCDKNIYFEIPEVWYEFQYIVS